MLFAVKPDVYVNNRLSLTLLSTSSIAAMAGLATDEAAKSVRALAPMMQDPEYGLSSDVGKSAFMYSRKDEYKDPDGSIFSWMKEHVCLISSTSCFVTD